jgi:predicted choloylglycine hydrolase
MGTCSRRKFIKTSAAAAAGLAFGPELLQGIPAVGSEDTDKFYPLLDIKGSHREIGYQIGFQMKERILDTYHNSQDFPKCVKFAEGPGREFLQKLLMITRDRFPKLVEELEGMAEGLDLPFMSVFAYNCRSEISVVQDTPGCSTFALKTKNRTLLVHNEDGHDSNAGRMILVKATPPSGVTFISLVYPGLLPGNGPGFNKNGIVQTTNYIQPRKLGSGVPRYFISRAILEAESLDQAVKIATHPKRAFSWHYNLMDINEGKILSLETVAWPKPKHSLIEVEGLKVHTNHLVHPGMNDLADDGEPAYDVPYISSTTRWRVLNEAMKKSGPPEDEAGIIKLLSLHEGAPYSPCRHPEGDVHGITLGTAVFQSGQPGMTLFHGNPCHRIKKNISI